MSKATQTLITTLVCTVLAACGGGGGSSDTTTATPTGTSGSGTTQTTPATPGGTTTSQTGQSTGDTSGTSTTTSSGANGTGSATGPGTSTGTGTTTGTATGPGGTTTPPGTTVPTSPATGTGTGTPPASTAPGSPAPSTPAATTADATQARFNGPTGMKFAANGDLYVADSRNFTIRRIAANGVVTTVAGKAGVRGSTDGTGATALFTEPRGITLDGAGNLYVTDGSVVRRITPTGVVTTIAGRQGEFDNLDGAGSNARFRTPDGIVIGGGGNLFVADSSTLTIRRITPAGAVTTFAGDTGSGTGFLFSGPNGLAIDGAGNLYVADVASTPGSSPILLRGSSFVRKITPAGAVTTLAGTFGHASTSNDTTPNAAISYGAGIAVDAAGNVYVTDHFNGGNGIKRISPAGAITALPITVQGGGFARLTTDAAGNLFVSDAFQDTIDRVASNGQATVYAGKAGEEGSADTP